MQNIYIYIFCIPRRERRVGRAVGCRDWMDLWSTNLWHPPALPTIPPEKWRFDLLPFYAILRSIPSKIIGVIAMFAAILILLALPFLDLSNIRGFQHKPLMKISFWFFVANFLCLMRLGGLHAEEPYITVSAFCTAFYFSWFLIILPVVSLIENSLMSQPTNK